MNQRFWQKIYRWLFLLAVGYGISVVTGKLVKQRYEHTSLKLSALDGEPFPGLRESEDSTGDFQDISQTILIDSIITIVQNYYVDAFRLTSRDLLDRALYVLTDNRDVRLINISEERIIVSSEGGRVELVLPENYTFDHLAIHAAQIAKILDTSSTEVSESDETNDTQTYPQTSYGAARFLNAMLQSLDPHSTLLNREEYRDLRQGTEGSFGGLGVVVGIKDDLLTVIKPLPESPAFRAGIVEDDKIMTINDIMTFGSSLDHLVQHMRGAPGTTVRLSLLRDGEEAPVEVSLKREVIQVSSVEGKILENDGVRTLQLFVESFSSRTTQEISQLIFRHNKQKPLDALILDLRSNPGGLLDQAVQVADLFLSNGDIVSTVGKRRELEKAYYDMKDVDLPLLVLINPETASASEIVAGALQDNNRAVIIGQPSFGKGTVQTVFELPGEKALKLTIARYYTPSGRTIQSIGIMPDIWLQPVWAKTENVNMLGLDRYRNEQFIAKKFLHLDQNKSRKNYTRQPEKYKGYYLIPEQDAEKEDYILSFAQELIRDLITKNDRPVPIERLRSSYWLANSHPMIKKQISQKSQQTESWLAGKVKIDWRKPVVPFIAFGESDILFKIHDEQKIEVVEGEKLIIPWSITNKSDNLLSRLSVFMIPDSHYLDTHEVLVGSLRANETKKGKIEVPINISSSHQSFSVTLGLAVDAWSQAHTVQKREIIIKPKNHPSIQYEVQLTGEEGGRILGVLEPGEQAFIEVNITNYSQYSAKSIVPQIANLTGKQVTLMHHSDLSKPFKLEPKQSRIVRFPVKVGEQIYHNKLHFGVTIESEDLLRPIKGSFVLDSDASFKTAKKE
ncbi:MAG: S41 family peptidase [Oligoflexus sp.]